MHLRELKMVFEFRSEYFLQWLEGRAFLSVESPIIPFVGCVGRHWYINFPRWPSKPSECP